MNNIHLIPKLLNPLYVLSKYQEHLGHNICTFHKPAVLFEELNALGTSIIAIIMIIISMFINIVTITIAFLTIATTIYSKHKNSIRNYHYYNKSRQTQALILVIIIRQFKGTNKVQGEYIIIVITITTTIIIITKEINV